MASSAKNSSSAPSGGVVAARPTWLRALARFLTPVRAVALYVVVAAGWFALADPLAGSLLGRGAGRAWMHIAFSWLFVVASGALMLWLIRRSYEPLKLSERMMRSTIQSMGDPLLLLDLHGNVIEANRAAVEMFGVSDERELTMHIHELGDRFNLRYADGRKVPFARYASDAALRGETIRRYEAIIRRADGSDLFITVSAASVQERPGAPVQMAVTVLHDIHELKRLEKLRDEFLSTAAHELKTPVATVKGYAQLLQRPSFPADGTLRALEVINRQCDRMDRVVRELLELSRVKSGHVQLNRERVDLAQLASEVVNRMQVLARGQRIVLETDGAVEVDVDRDRIDQVLVNLLDNAIKFSPQGGEIRVQLAPDGDQARINVIDHGMGIPVERQPHIFERFYQAHVGEVRSTAGMGVGLHLAREILALHGGRIWFESIPGQGTTFTMSLPRATESGRSIPLIH